MKFNHWQRTLLFILALSLAGCQSKEIMLPDNDLQLQEHTESAKCCKGTGPYSVQSRIRDYLLSHQINGSVAVIKNKKSIFNEGIGYNDLKARSFNRPDTTYPIGSITKTFVATSVMQLQEKGKLSIKDPVEKYLPHFPNGKKIRLIHLLSHTSGIQPPLLRIGIKSPKDLISRIAKRPVKFPAGKRWDYRDENYVILGYIVEKTAKVPLHRYIEKNIFAKAGMQHSGFITKKHPVPYKSDGYIKNNRKVVSKGITTSFLFGFGDIYATAYDLCLYDEALLNGKLVSKKSLRDMLKPRSKSKYGIGLYNSGNAVYSRGVIGGFEAFHVYYKDKIAITILINIRDKGINIHKVGKDLHKITASY